jgi:dihydrofolate reductase
MKTVFFTAVSLDGYIADSHHSLDWLFQFGDGDDDSFSSFLREVGAVVMGSNTYEWVLRNHVFLDPDQPKDWPYEQPAWVFTSRPLAPVTGAGITFASGDIAPVFSDIREAAGEKSIWVVGGGDLAAQFHERGWLDEIIVTIAPVILTGGAPLFTRQIVNPPPKVLEVKPQASGLTQMRLKVRHSS